MVTAVALVGHEVEWFVPVYSLDFEREGCAATMPTIEERDRYARRAMELRAMAETVGDPEIKQTLAGMVASYDKLVEEADRIADMRARIPTI